MALKELTKAEEQVMQIMWDLKQGFLKDIVERFPKPRPAYTTVSTVIRVLVKKKFLGFRTYGKINEYFPLIQKPEYFNSRIRPVISNYFDDSPSILTSYFADTKLNLSELQEIRQLIDEKIKKLKNKTK
jgi:BlaI family transcriptional regulator, penicillinase repressor